MESLFLNSTQVKKTMYEQTIAHSTDFHILYVKLHLTYEFLLFICLCTDSFLPQMVVYMKIATIIAYHVNAHIILLWKSEL